MCVTESPLNLDVLVRTIERVEALRLRRETGCDYRVTVSTVPTSVSGQKESPARDGARAG